MPLYQCGRCRKRCKFKRQPPIAKRECKICGGKLHSCSRHVRKWNGKFTTCTCGLIPYPHREGTKAGDALCAYHPECDPFGSKWGP